MKITMSATAQAFKKVVKGGSLFIVGTFLGLSLQFISGVITVRYISKSEYGLMSIGYALVNFLVVISRFGFLNAVPRLLSHALSVKDYVKAKGVIFTSLITTSIVSSSIGILFFLLAPVVSRSFSKPELTEVIKLFSILIPILAVFGVIIVIFRGLEEVKPKVLFQDVGSTAIKIIFLLIVILMDMKFKGVLLANILSFFFSFLLLVHYTCNRIPSFILDVKTEYIWKELIAFSLPLFGLGILNLISTWTDTLMLGYFKASSEVAIYNVALKLAKLIPIPLDAASFLYLPIATKLFGERKFLEIKYLYSCVTKWLFLLTLPILLLLTLYSKFSVAFIFGSKYSESALILQLLALGFFIHTFLGPNGMTLFALGKTKLLFFSGLISTIVNVILNLVLIPKWGAVGASLATMFSLFVSNIIISVGLYFCSKIHPFTANYLKPIIFTSIFALLIYRMLKLFVIHELLLLMLFVVLVLCAILPSLFFTKSIDEVDKSLLKAVKNRLLGK